MILKLCTKRGAPLWQNRRTGKRGAAKIYVKMPPPSEDTVSFHCGQVEEASTRFLPHRATLAPPQMQLQASDRTPSSRPPELTGIWMRHDQE
jgi:hypothetical protein